MKYALNGMALAGFVVVGSSAYAETLPQTTAYTFTGKVVSASAACPHKKGVEMKGYAVWPGIKAADAKAGEPAEFAKGHAFLIMFSEGTTIRKLGYALKAGNDFKPPYTSVSGTAKAAFTNLDIDAGTWSAIFGYDTDTKFGATITLSYKLDGSPCAIEYQLDFVRGLPNHLTNLL